MLEPLNAASLLDHASADDADEIRRAVAAGLPADELSQWYTSSAGVESVTPLMVAAMYGAYSSVVVLLAAGADPNCRSSSTLSTPLHFAASGGSVAAPEVVRLLLDAGADATIADSLKRLPADVIAVPPRRRGLRVSLHELLGGESPNSSSSFTSSPKSLSASLSSLSSSSASSPPSAVSERKEWPSDPSLPDIKNGVYASDEFRMYSFKVKPCSRAYSHDWTECPFVHPGENARRRDPRKYHYSCVPCPEFRKGICHRGDLCEHSHGVFESWLHPAQYRTRLCKDGVVCTRRVCFFAHMPEELRPLHMPTGPAVLSPRGTATGTFDAGVLGLTVPLSPYTPPLSPSGNGGGHLSAAWGMQQNVAVPALQLPPGNNLQLSRLRASLNAWDAFDDISAVAALDARLSLPVAGTRSTGGGKLLVPSNWDELFADEAGSSPQYANVGEQNMIFSPTPNNIMINLLHQQQQAFKASANSSGFSIFPPATLPGNMSQQNSPAEPVSPMNARLLNVLAHIKEQQHQRAVWNLSSSDLGTDASGVGSLGGVNWKNWGSPSRSLDWGVNVEEHAHLGQSSFPESQFGTDGDDPDLSWVSTLVKDFTPDMSVGKDITSSSNGTIVRATDDGLYETEDENEGAVLSTWLN